MHQHWGRQEALRAECKEMNYKSARNRFHSFCGDHGGYADGMRKGADEKVHIRPYMAGKQVKVTVPGNEEYEMRKRLKACKGTTQV